MTKPSELLPLVGQTKRYVIRKVIDWNMSTWVLWIWDDRKLNPETKTQGCYVPTFFRYSAQACWEDLLVLESWRKSSLKS